jgi:Ni/Co efflux regulator RcnB
VRGRPYYFPRGYGYRAWGFGEYLPDPFISDQYVIYDYYDYGLPQPPPGFEWVRVGPDALLVRPYDGYILDVARGLFF